MHYTMSFHRQVPADPNWFRWPFLALTLGVIALQVSAYMKRLELERTLTTRHELSESPKELR
jgi:hypothetical protein